jgi:RNA polymerase sigma-70 factor (ECF subfamily)
MRAVLPLEAQLLGYLRRRCAPQDDVRNILHDVYEKALVGATKALPQQTRAYLFAIAHNLLVDHARRKQVVSLEFIADLDILQDDEDPLTPERHATARDELRRALEGIDSLPPRCREVVRLRKVEGLRTSEVAARLHISVGAVERQMTLGMRALTDFMLGGSGKVLRTRYGKAVRSREGRRD